MSSINDFNQTVIEEFRANNGVVGGGFAGAPVVLLHTTGAKSGTERVNPLVALVEGDKLYVIASKAGAPTSPARWGEKARIPSRVNSSRMCSVVPRTDRPSG